MIIWRNLDQKMMGQLLVEAGRAFARRRRRKARDRSPASARTGGHAANAGEARKPDVAPDMADV